MEIDPLLIYAQLAIDVILVLVVLVLFRRLRSLEPSNLDSIIYTLKTATDQMNQLNQILESLGELSRAKASSRDDGVTASSADGTKAKGNHAARTMQEIPAGRKARLEAARLAATGASIDEIAAATGLSKGEVELIAALHGKQSPPDPTQDG